MNNQKDNVVNFLAPTKLITGSLKPKTRNRPSDSLFNSSSNKKNQGPFEQNSKNYNSQFERLNYGFNRSQEEVEPLYQEMQDSRQKYKSQYNRNYGLQNASKGFLKSQDNFHMNIIDKVQTRSENVNQSSFILHKVEVENQSGYKKLIQNSGIEQEPLRFSKVHDNKESPVSEADRNRDYYPQPSITEGLNSMIMQLKEVKNVIQNSLAQLQQILDNTSKSLQNMDEEYARIKQRVLDFTSQALDAGFTRYRHNMVNWTKYEEVEMKAKLMIQQLEKTIKQDQFMVQEMSKLSKKSQIISSKQIQLNEKVELYSNFIAELQSSRIQCLSMRPQLKRDRILIFEEALVGLADF